MKEIKCNGSCWPRVLFSEKTKALAFSLFDELRPIFLKENAKGFDRYERYYSGRRFNTNDTLLVRIESATVESEFLASPKEWAWEALRECAASDYWYTFEKQW